MIFSTSTQLSVLSAAALVLSIPLLANASAITRGAYGCSVAGAKLILPTNQTVIAVPSGTPVYIALGVGTQNYTCSAAGTYASAGAVAKLFDLSCLVNTTIFPTVQDKVYDIGATDQGQALIAKIESVLEATPFLLGDHYFITNPAPGGTGLSPTFDFRAGVKKGDVNGFVVAKKLGGIPSPDGPANVDWLALQNIGGTIGGTLANAIMRVDTKGGQPPASCTPNATVTVPYTAKYWFYK